MFTPEQIKKLQANWGEKAESFQCNVEVLLMIPPKMKMYVLGMSPEDTNLVFAIYSSPYSYHRFKIDTFPLDEFKTLSLHFGTELVIDQEFKPIWAETLWKKLEEEWKQSR